MLKGPAAARHALYMSIQNVVYLKENMRFPAVPEWGTLLTLICRGMFTARVKVLLKTPSESRVHMSMRDKK